MGAIKKAFESIGKGIEKAVESVGQIAKGIATLDLKTAAKGLKGLAEAGMDVARGAINLTPAALAANTLLDGALDKVLKKAQKVATTVTDTMVDSVENGLSNIKDGMVNTVKGIAKGDFNQVMDGLKDLGMGALETASNFGPGGVAKNVARAAVDAVVDMAVGKVTETAAKVLDPNGTSKLGGMAADFIGTAAGAAAGGGGTRGSRDACDVGVPKRSDLSGPEMGGTRDARNTRGTDDTKGPDGVDNTNQRGSARDNMRDTGADMAEDMAYDMVSMGVQELTNKISNVVDPNGSSSIVSGATDMAGSKLEDAANDQVTKRRERVGAPRTEESKQTEQTGQTGQTNQTGQTDKTGQPDKAGKAGQTNETQKSEEVEPAAREKVSGAVQDTMAAVLQAALIAMIQKAIDRMSPKDAGALAGLDVEKAAQVATSNPSSKAAQGRAVAAQALRQEMQTRIEGAVRTGVENAMETITAAAMQYASDAAKNPGKANSAGLKDVVQDTIGKVVKQVSDAVGQIVADVASKASDRGLGEKLKPSIDVVNSSIQHADEVRIRA